MAKRTLTDRALKALKAAKAGKRYDIADSVVPGLAIRVTDTGQKTFVLVARYPGSKNPTRLPPLSAAMPAPGVDAAG